jgi:phosphatidylglycerophosphatase C
MGNDEPGGHPARTIVAFDFDGTLTTRDSFMRFVGWEWPRRRFVSANVAAAPLLALHAMHLVPNEVHKMALFRSRFEGMGVEGYRERAGRFARHRVPALLRASALDCLRRHQALGHHVVVVTASFSDWVAPWAAQLGIDEVIASQAEVRDGRLTGRMEGSNCHGPEKLRRLLARYPERGSYVLYAYGDSRGDRELLAAADHSFYRRFA